MGRYSSVQAYADSQSNMRSVSYEQATGSSEAKKGAVKAEKVSNPYGSTAGAGSGEFHVYRHARSREMERWQKMEEAEKKEQLDGEFEENLKQSNEELSSRTEKNRNKRQRQKEARMRKKNLQLSGVAATVVADQDAAKSAKAGNEEEEFTYTPMQKDATAGDTPNDEKDANKQSDLVDTKKPAIPSDGSFLEMMKAQMEAAKKDNQESAVDTTENDEGPPAKRQATGKSA